MKGPHARAGSPCFRRKRGLAGPLLCGRRLPACTRLSCPPQGGSHYSRIAPIVWMGRQAAIRGWDSNQHCLFMRFQNLHCKTILRDRRCRERLPCRMSRLQGFQKETAGAFQDFPQVRQGQSARKAPGRAWTRRRGIHRGAHPHRLGGTKAPEQLRIPLPTATSLCSRGSTPATGRARE